jgi:pyruvate kinase
VPDGAVLALAHGFDEEFAGDTEKIAGIVDVHEGMTGYAAMIARELDRPLVGDVSLSDEVADGTVVTIDGERGVVYEGDLAAGPRER